MTAGAPLDVAEAALVLVHGRGATAQSIVQMADEIHFKTGHLKELKTWHMLPDVFASISPEQRTALEVALEQGYYETHVKLRLLNWRID